MEKHHFQSMIGFLAYLAVSTQPDIFFVLSVLSRQLSDPIHYHISLAKRATRYVSAKQDKIILFSSPSCSFLTANTDADWAGSHETRRSTSEIIKTVNGAPVFWTSQRQTLVALSLAEAEYLAISQCGNFLLWLQSLFWELSNHRPTADEPDIPPANVFTDSANAFALITTFAVLEKTNTLF